MTKSDLAARIAELNAYMSVRNADRIISIIINKIVKSLKNGSRVELRGFGSFGVKERNSTEGRNPRTGEKVFINAKKVPFFRAGKPLKDAINRNADVKTATIVQLIGIDAKRLASQKNSKNMKKTVRI
jgi:integration host factor subunit beta